MSRGDGPLRATWICEGEPATGKAWEARCRAAIRVGERRVSKPLRGAVQVQAVFWCREIPEAWETLAGPIVRALVPDVVVDRRQVTRLTLEVIDTTLPPRATVQVREVGRGS